jgi:signal transduction histidine kinase
MTSDAPRSRSWLEQTLAVLTLVVVAAYTYALFYERPYLGFLWDTTSGRVLRVYQGTAMQPGDTIIQIGSIAVDELGDNLRAPTLDARPGDTLPLVIQRDGQRLTLEWRLPALNHDEFVGRLTNQWILAVVFWVVGELSLVLVRPKDARWRLLGAFYFITALWLAASINSTTHIWQSAIVLRMAVWLSVPIYWHLHWVFPQPLRRLPAFVWPALYGAALLLAAAEWFQLLPSQLYTLGFLLALGGTLILLVARLLLRHEQRRAVGWLVAAAALAFLPPISLGLAATQGTVTMGAMASILFLPSLPLGYFYVAYRRQLGQTELRVNRIISLYLYLALIGVAVVVLQVLLLTWIVFPGSPPLIGYGVGLLAAGGSALGFPAFQRFVERWVLGIPLPPAQLVEAYSARITTSLDRDGLVRLLRDEISPSLPVRQSALLVRESDQLQPLYAQGVNSDELPAGHELPALMAEAGKYRPPATGDLSPPWAWVRLILPLRIETQTIGLWLLGSHDPDDFYTQSEIATLQTLAHQIAVALTNLVYAERLHALYQTSIDQREAERASLGRDLHDHILQQLFALKGSAAGCLDSQAFLQNYEALVQAMYQTIRGLRPPMLEYGLYRALAALVDDWANRPDAQGGPAITLDIPETDVRYAPYVEQHLYRIVQQAGDNARRHARAQKIEIRGRLEAGGVELAVEDDGQGFEAARLLDLGQPDSRSHFGLIGMQERAALIQGQVKFDSVPGRGTCVYVTWQSDHAKE